MADQPRILFLHRNQQAQFEFFARFLAKRGWAVTFAHAGAPSDTRDGHGIRSLRFPAPEDTFAPEDFRYALDHAAQTAAAAAELFVHLRDVEGYRPDVVVAHVGWGIGLCVRQVWPDCRYVAYHEWYYTDYDWDAGRAERPSNLASIATHRMRNLPIAAEFDSADAHWCPTAFQASRFPPVLRRQLTVIPDGVDCTTLHPDSGAAVDFDWLSLPDRPKLLTYTTRGMEPLRGFPQFMQAVALLQRRRPDFHTLVLARDAVSYGPRLQEGDSWCSRAMAALEFDRSRLHIHDMKPRGQYRRVLQASAAHIHFTEPFVTSWSLSEAMAAGCLVIGSNTAPVQELIVDMQTGVLVDMDDPEEVADMVEWVFDHPEEAALIRARARAQMLARFDANIVFARKAKILKDLIG